VCFDTSGNGRHLTFTVADTSVVCMSGKEKGSNHCATKGWSDEGIGYVGKLVPNRTDQVSDAATIPRLAERINLGATAGYVMQITDAQLITNDTYPYDVFAKDGNGGVHCVNSGALAFCGTTASIPVVAGRIYEVTMRGDLVTGSTFGPSLVVGIAEGNLDSWWLELTAEGTGYVDGLYRRYFRAQTTRNIALQFPMSNAATPREFTISDIVIKEHIPVNVQNYIKDTICCWGDSTTEGVYPYRLSNNIISGNVYNGGVGGNTSPIILERFLASPEKHGEPTIIWSGANSANGSASIVIDSIASMVEALTTDEFIVMSPMGNSTATIGTQYRANLNAIRDSLSASYGSKFLDIEQHIIDSYNPSVPQDVIDHNNGITPSSLRVDTIHLTYDGYDLVTAKLLATFPQFFVRQAGTSHIKYPGRAKYNLTPISNPADTTIVDANTYSLANADQVRKALGWIYGVDHWAYSDAGVAKVITGATIKANAAGPDAFADANGFKILDWPE